MHPDSRSIHRFFHGLTEVCPVSQLSHLHLVHWPTDPPSPLDALQEAGFRGSVVVARASLADAIRHEHPAIPVILDDHPTGRAQADHILMELPQGREAARLSIAAALAALGSAGRLWLFGNRESGILSLSKRYSGVETALCKGHLRLLGLDKSSELLPEKGKTTPFVPQEEGFFFLTVATIKTALKPGIFSWQTIDPATLLLLEAIQEHPGERVLDWGCGSGFLGAALARRFPDIQVVMSDDLVTATACARRTVALNDLADRCQVFTEDGIGKNLETMRFDAIVTNPPFHRGVRTNHDATFAFLASASGILNPGGALWLVGNRNLDYGTLLKESFTHVEEIDGDESFTVWRGIKARDKAATKAKTRTKTRAPRSQQGGDDDGQWLEVATGQTGDEALRRRIAAWTQETRKGSGPAR